MLWETGMLDESFEELLRAYTNSTSGSDGGTPAELIQGASRISAEHVTVHTSGPSNCTPGVEQTSSEINEEGADDTVNQCAAVIDGGIDDVSLVKIWNTIMENTRWFRCATSKYRSWTNKKS